MRVLVTGVAGFIGSHVAEALLSEGHDVVGVDAFIDSYPRATKERNLGSASRHRGFSFHELDLRTDDLSRVVDGVDAVVHEAALPGLPQSWTRFDDYLTCNLVGLQRLLVALKPATVRRFVHVSTSSVYGSLAYGAEDAPTRPTSPYGVTKLAGEHLVQAYGTAFGMPYVIVRYFSVYGPRQRPDMAYNIFIRALMEGRPITVYGDGLRSRSNTYVDDCVRGTVQALHRARDGEIYNIGGSEAVTVTTVIKMLGELLEVEPKIEFAPDRVGDQVHTLADTTKARQHFAFEPSVKLRTGLRRQVEWQTAGSHALVPDVPIVGRPS